MPMIDMRVENLRQLYRVIWQFTRRQQLMLIVLAVLVAGLAAAPLKFQQLVINNLVEDAELAHIAWLCAGFATVALLSAGLKFLLNFRLSVLGEQIVLRIRQRLYENYVADTRADDPGRPKRGTLVTMLAAEAEAVGTFAGSAIAIPLMQFGTLTSVIAFIAVSQPWLGLLALGVVVPQALIVVLMQARINRRVRERVQALRDASDRISESDLRQIEHEISADFDQVFVARRRVFLLKLSTKFALNAISLAGTVGILFLGGWLVLEGRSDVGTVVASMLGLKRIEGPWRELVAFFRNASTVRVKYAMLVDAIIPRLAAKGLALEQ